MAKGKEHYVPQFYLKQFANAQGQIYVFDKFRRSSFVTAVKDAASENHFYDIHPDIHRPFLDDVAEGKIKLTESEIAVLQDNQFIEHELAKMEAVFSTTLRDVLQTVEKKQQLTDAQCWSLAEFLALQYSRTPLFRRRQIDTYTGITEEMLKRFGGSPEASVVFDERYASVHHASHMFNSETQKAFCQTLFQHIWLIGENVTDHQLYTSDAPIVLHSQVKDPHRGAGLGTFGIQVAFPLNPRYVLIMCERSTFSNQTYRERTVFSLTPDSVMYYNSLQVFQSYRSIYCQKGEFLLAAEICAKHPDICVAERSLVQII